MRGGNEEVLANGGAQIVAEDGLILPAAVLINTFGRGGMVARVSGVAEQDGVSGFQTEKSYQDNEPLDVGGERMWRSHALNC